MIDSRESIFNQKPSRSDSVQNAFLRPTEVVDWTHSAVRRQATDFNCGDKLATARACFEFVRDEIKHSCDFGLDPATCRASDVLMHRTGYCYAKSHLLAALLRANGIPAGFCYQRLSVDDSGLRYCLHGFNAIQLPNGDWYRVDARGNKAGVDAQFDPPVERLAFQLQSPGEFEFENAFSDPLPCIVSALQQSRGWKDVFDRLPDASPQQFTALGLVVRSQGVP